MDPRTRKLVGLLVIGLVLVGVLLVAGPHGVLHHGSDGGGCALCFVHALEGPEPLHVERPALRVVRRTIRGDERPPTGRAGSACDARAPPEKA